MDVSGRCGLLGKWPHGATSSVWRGRRGFEAGDRGRQSRAEGLSPCPAKCRLCRLWPVWRDEEPRSGRTVLTHCFPSRRPAFRTDTTTAQRGSVSHGGQCPLWHNLQDRSKFKDQNLEEHGFSKP